MTQGRPGGGGAWAPLWERDAELAAAEGAVSALCSDLTTEGGLLVYSGEAGIGKTALLSEVRRIAQGRATVLAARGGETVAEVPFNVVRQLLQPVLVQLSPEEGREYLGDWYEIAGPALGITEPGSGRPDPQAVCDGLVDVVARLSRLYWPLVLIVDDAHWADQETLRWLAAFAERLDDLPTLVVVAHRPGEATGEGARHLARIGATALPTTPLRALTPDATAGLTRATLGEHADAPFCREVWAVTGGNPYESVELLAKVQDSELEPVESSAAELRDLNRSARGRGLVARLEDLGTDVTRFAWAAAILGPAISTELAASLAGMPHDDAARCAERLRAARIVTSGEAGLEFVHPLIATAVYESIPNATRTAMHGRAAWAVTRSGRGAAAASRHLLEVHPDDDPELVQHLRDAATEHLAVGAPDAAWSGPCANRPGPRCTPACSTNSAAPRCSPHPSPPSGICARPCRWPVSASNCASTPCAGSPRPWSTTTSSAKACASSTRRPRGSPTAPPGCGSRPCTTCGRASTPARRTHRDAPDASPRSPVRSPAATTPSVRCSSCAPSTP